MQRWFAVTACIALTACGGSSRGAPSVDAPPASSEEHYEFSATTPNQVIRGEGCQAACRLPHRFRVTPVVERG
jgi:hypothetical protein